MTPEFRGSTRGLPGQGANHGTPMTTKLQQPFKRELDINGEKYTLTVTPEGFKLVVKGKRKGVELAWASIVGGDAALATALNASTLGARQHDLHGHGHGSHTKH